LSSSSFALRKAGVGVVAVMMMIAAADYTPTTHGFAIAFVRQGARTSFGRLCLPRVQPVRSLLCLAAKDMGSDDIARSSNYNAFDGESEEDLDGDFLDIPTRIPSSAALQWELGNDFEQFLNQCTVQTFMFLLKTLRDPQTILYIEAFTQPSVWQFREPNLDEAQRLPSGGSGNSILLSYHGLTAMNTTAFPSWTSYFVKLLERPVECYIIESWLDHIADYEMEVNPPSLCSRMIKRPRTDHSGIYQRSNDDCQPRAGDPVVLPQRK
jgi:hypothetical protein